MINYSKPSDWHSRRIKNISKKITAGATPNTKVQEYWEGGDIPWMSSGEVNNRFIYRTEKYITKKGFEKSSTSVVPLQSVLMGLAGQGKTRGKVAINYIELTTNQSLASITPTSEINPQFLFFNLDSRYKELRRLSTGEGGRGGLNLQIIKTLKVDYPANIKEQEKIAKILLTWEEAISLKQEIIEKYTLYKKAYQQIIYRGELKVNNHKFEKTRLRNYLSEVKTKNKDDEIQTVLSVTNSKGFVLQSDQFGKTVASKNLKGYKIVSKNQFAFNPSRINVGSVSILEEFEHGLLSPMYVVFKAKDNIDKKYLFHYIKSSEFVRRIPSYVQGSVRDSLSFDAMKAMPIYLTDIRFQEQIANLFDKIDEAIKLHQDELVYIMDQKNGLMQQLLTGKIRVQC
jgi:type I restriction enzyme S subunit